MSVFTFCAVRLWCFSWREVSALTSASAPTCRFSERLLVSIEGCLNSLGSLTLLFFS